MATSVTSCNNGFYSGIDLLIKAHELLQEGRSTAPQSIPCIPRPLHSNDATVVHFEGAKVLIERISNSNGYHIMYAKMWNKSTRILTCTKGQKGGQPNRYYLGDINLYFVKQYQDARVFENGETIAARCYRETDKTEWNTWSKFFVGNVVEVYEWNDTQYRVDFTHNDQTNRFNSKWSESIHVDVRGNVLPVYPKNVIIQNR
eukprot:153911_1